MGKEKQEEICFANLISGKGGKYVRKKLRVFREAHRVSEWSESPDYLAEDKGRALAVEHFAVDQIYIERRSSNRLANERLWEVYKKHHSTLEDDAYNPEAACEDIEKEIQFGVNQATRFDYDICMQQFERVFNNHVRKIPKYHANLSQYEKRQLFFLIEYNSWEIGRYGDAVKCLAIRKDGGVVRLCGNCIILTTRMVEILRAQIGILDGVILQSYSALDLNMSIKKMMYLDLSSEENFEKSIIEQNIEIYIKYYLEAPKIDFKLYLDNSG